MMAQGPGSGGERIDVDRAFELYRQRQVTFVDVRGRDDFERGHVPGALSVPISELSRRIDEIPREHPVVTYCA